MSGQPATPSGHLPVLREEVLEGLAVRPGGRYLDATVGGGGHAQAILQASAPDGRVLALDADPEAIQRVRARLAPYVEQGRLILVQAFFDEMASVAAHRGFRPVHGILMDLGVSSYQLDEPRRGFSFQADAPLDMRFHPGQGPSAADLVNRLSVEELAEILWRYGQERHSRRIARAIVAARPIHTTGQLARIVERTVGRRGSPRIHPATRTFQALRIAVNDELGRLERALPQALDLLAVGGRLAVISFHSLEDRIVKHWMREEARDRVHIPGHLWEEARTPRLRILTKKPIRPTSAEVARNPRSRSARLRIAERIA